MHQCNRGIACVTGPQREQRVKFEAPPRRRSLWIWSRGFLAASLRLQRSGSVNSAKRVSATQ